MDDVHMDRSGAAKRLAPESSGSGLRGPPHQSNVVDLETAVSSVLPGRLDLIANQTGDSMVLEVRQEGKGVSVVHS